MELRRLSAAELSLYLEGHAPGIRELLPEEREAVIRMTLKLLDRDLAQRFILASVNNTIELLRAPETAPAEPAVETPVLDTPPAAEEARRLAGIRLAERTRAVLREARAAHRSNEVRKMRGVLREIDQGRLRDSLGAEGDRLCQEINGVLAGLAQPVRRGRPRSQRVMA